jgi:hypothetical protein
MEIFRAQHAGGCFSPILLPQLSPNYCQLLTKITIKFKLYYDLPSVLVSGTHLRFVIGSVLL